jgi:hypothetical protein
MRPAVLPEFRPTLPELLRPRLGRRLTTAVLALALLTVAVAAGFVALGPASDGTNFVQRAEPVQFNLRYTDGLERMAPRGDQLLHLEARRGDLFVQSFTVSPLRLPSYRREVGGFLPVLAPAEIDALRERFSEFELVQDGKSRVNEAPGYSVLFRARLGRRRLYGRSIMLPELEPGARDGVRLLLLATPAGGVSKAADVGVRGVIKRPYRTFRFGTERP